MRFQPFHSVPPAEPGAPRQAGEAASSASAIVSLARRLRDGFAGPLIAAVALAGPAHAGTVFGHADPGAPPSIILNAVGLAIIALVAAPSLGGLITAAWILHRGALAASRKPRPRSPTPPAPSFCR